MQGITSKPNELCKSLVNVTLGMHTGLNQRQPQHSAVSIRLLTQKVKVRLD